MNSQNWYPALIEQQFLLSTKGDIEFLSQKNDQNVVIAMAILPSSLIYWWGCHIELEEIQTKRKITWFIFKDSVTKQDYARLSRLVKIKQFG